MQAEAVSTAFQVFRRANLKAGEGQYYTPARIVRAAVKLIDIQPDDKIIDCIRMISVHVRVITAWWLISAARWSERFGQG